jgi:hypothetical protein
MTNSNQETNSNQDWSKSFFDFLKTLIQSPLLYILSAGFFLVCFAASENIPVIGRITLSWGSSLLFILGVGLIIVSARVAIGETRKATETSRKTANQNKTIEQLSQNLEAEEKSRQELETVVQNALQSLEAKDKKDATDSQVIQLLQKRTTQILKELQGTPNQDLTADWINNPSRRRKWLDALKDSDYSLGSTQEQQQFFQDIEQHLDLLVKNLRNDGFRSPKVEGLTKHIQDSSAYVRAFKDLKTQVQREMAEEAREMAEEATLNYTCVEYFRDHIDFLINRIND